MTLSRARPQSICCNGIAASPYRCLDQRGPRRRGVPARNGLRTCTFRAIPCRQQWAVWLGYVCWRFCASVSSVAVMSTTSHPAEPHTGSVSAKLNWLRAGVLGANDGIVSTAGIVVGVAAASASTGPILTARTVAEELTDHDAFAAHADVELGIDPTDLTNPWHAAASSAVAFTVGALLPLIAILLPPHAFRIPVTVAAVLVALVITGAASAALGGAAKQRAVARNVVGGGLALVITYLIGHLLGAAIA